VVNADLLHTVYVSIGSNLGDRWEHLRGAIRQLQQWSGRNGRCSSVYETEPVGYLNQPLFLNMVVEMKVLQSPLEVLDKLHDLEAQNGRQRTVRFGPRTLDLDLLLYDNEYVCFRHLQVPHPRMWERAFVLKPLAELIPNHRGQGGQTVREMAKFVTREGQARYVGHVW